MSELGQREQALAASREVVAIRRSLATRNPDAFQPDLARSLSILAGALSELGQREQALAAAREAVAISRALVIALHTLNFGSRIVAVLAVSLGGSGLVSHVLVAA